MTLKIDKISRRPHLSTMVASSLTREIAEGRLKVGDQLPTEQELAVTFGVSRTVVREAIARLRSEGRVWSQQGRGAFVADIATSTVLMIDNEAMQDLDSFRSLFELRGILEVKVAGIAARRRSEEDVGAMRSALEAMARAPYGSTTWLNADFEFHRRVAVATHNPYAEQVLFFVSGRIRESILASGHQRRSDDLASVTVGEHQRVLDAIVNSDVVRAEASMRDHLAGAAQRLSLPAFEGE